MIAKGVSDFNNGIPEVSTGIPDLKRWISEHPDGVTEISHKIWKKYYKNAYFFFSIFANYGIVVFSFINNGKLEEKEMKKIKKIILQQVGIRVKTARDILRMTQTQFAKKMEMSNTHISDIEVGKCGAGFNFFYRLSLHHKINPLYILHGIEPVFFEEPEKKVALRHPMLSVEKNDWWGADAGLMRDNIELMKTSPLVRLAVMQFVTQYSLENKTLIEAELAGRQGHRITSGDS